MSQEMRPSSLDMTLFDTFVKTWIPYEENRRNHTIFQSLQDDPCLLDRIEIFYIDPSKEYEELVNHV